MQNVILKNFHLIDAVSEEAIPDTSIKIENGRIADLAFNGNLIEPHKSTVIDLQGSWLLPGLWDVHVHLMFPDLPPISIAERVIKYGLNATEGIMQGGVTSIRTAGTEEWIDVAWREAFNSGKSIGPRIFAAGYFLTTTAGHAKRHPFTRQLDGPVEFIRGVREQIMHGVDQIKLNLSGGIMGPGWDRHWHNFLLENEIQAAFDVCHQRDMPIMSHATNPEAVKDAIRLGTTSIEHGYIMDDECIKMMLDTNTFYVPTLGISHLTPNQITTEWESNYLKRRNISNEMLMRADAASEEHRKWFRKALDAGISMALGSDLGPIKDAVHLEMGLWIRNGATPIQTIKAATITSAQACGVSDKLGSVEIGKLADLIVVKDNPLENINHLRTILLVLKEGRIITDRLKSTS